MLRNKEQFGATFRCEGCRETVPTELMVIDDYLKFPRTLATNGFVCVECWVKYDLEYKNSTDKIKI